MASEEAIEAAALHDRALAAAVRRDRERTVSFSGLPLDEEAVAVRPSPQPRVEEQPRRQWGTAWSPQFPIERQLVREASDLIRGQELARAERRASQAAARRAAIAAEAAADGATPADPSAVPQPPAPPPQQRSSVRLPAGRQGPRPPPGGPREPMLGYQTWASESAVGARRPPGDVGRGGPRSLSASALQPVRDGKAPPLPPPHHRPSPRKPKYEPAKVMGPDGKIRLRGVQSVSDIARFAREIDPYSNKGWQVREVFKARRSQQNAAMATAASTWDALHKWTASEKPLDEWLSSKAAKGAGSASGP